MSKKIYLSPENRPAPHGPYTGYTGVYEHDVCCEIAEHEKKALERCGFYAEIADPAQTIQAANGYTRQQYANDNGFDLYQTIHTNAGGGTGAECLYYQDPNNPNNNSIRANQCVYDELVKLYPSKRGLKNGTGYAENNQTEMVSVYPELAFHDNAADARFLVQHKQELAEALAKGICTYFGVEYVLPQTGGEDTVPRSEYDRVLALVEKFQNGMDEQQRRAELAEDKLQQAIKQAAELSARWQKLQQLAEELAGALDQLLQALA